MPDMTRMPPLGDAELTRHRVTDADFAAMMRRMLRAYGRRVGTGDTYDLSDLADFAALCEQTLREAVWAQRAAGASWAEVGAALGITKQAAAKRFGDPQGTATRRPGGQPAQYR